MCRLFACNGTFIHWLNEDTSGQEMLETHLQKLEDSFGGDGNGVYIRTKDKQDVALKGLFLTNAEIAELVWSYIGNIEVVIYHTRAASSGSICDKFCQPFEGKRYALAHNGHSSLFHNNRQGLSDTAAIAQALEKGLLSVGSLENISSHFMSYDKFQELFYNINAHSGMRLLTDSLAHRPTVWCLSSEMYDSYGLHLCTLDSGMWTPYRKTTVKEDGFLDRPKQRFLPNRVEYYPSDDWKMSGSDWYDRWVDGGTVKTKPLPLTAKTLSELER